MATIRFSACEPEFIFSAKASRPIVLLPCVSCKELEQIRGAVTHQTHNRLVLLPNQRPVAGNRDCNSFSWIFLFTRHKRVRNHVHKCPPLVPDLSHINPVHAVLSHLSSTLILSSQVFKEVSLLQVPNPASVCISLLHCAQRMRLPVCLPSLIS